MLKQVIGFMFEEMNYRMAYSWYDLTDVKKHTRKPVLVNGSPKTGTTWMLRLITSFPGYRIANGYNFQGDINRYHQMLSGEVVHGHDPYSPQLWQILQSEDIKVILMVRDPRDQTVSRMFHIRRDENHLWKQRLESMNDDEALMACIEGHPKLPGTATMIALTNSWINAGEKALCIKYENLLLDPVGHLEKALNYFGVSVSKKLIRAIVDRNSFARLSVGRKIWKSVREPGQEDPSSHYRKGIIGDWKNYFKPAHIQRYKEVAGQHLIELGYEKDFNW